MIYLLLAIVSSSLISVIMRLSSDRVRGNFSTLSVNYLTCCLLGAFYAIDTPTGSGLPVTLALGTLGGVLFLAAFVLFQVCIRRSGVVLASVFMKLGLLVPFALSVLVFREVPTGVQVVGFCLAIGAIVLLNLKKEESSGTVGPLLILLLLLGGGADAMPKIFDVFGRREQENLFLVVTFGVALVLCVGLVILKKERPGKNELLYGALIGIPNFFSSKFLLGALESIPAVVVYPTFCVSTMLLVTLTGVLAFREKLNRLQCLALAVILVALALLNT